MTNLAEMVLSTVPFVLSSSATVSGASIAPKQYSSKEESVTHLLRMNRPLKPNHIAGHRKGATRSPTPINRHQKNNSSASLKADLLTKSDSILSHLNCLYTNATSLNQAKIGELEPYLANLHLIFVAETWFNETSSVNIKDFNVVRHDRIGPHGGVAVYIRSDAGLTYSEVFAEELDLAFMGTAEQTWICLYIGQEKLLIGCAYRPPPGYSSLDANQAIDLSLLSTLRAASDAVRWIGTGW